MVTKPRTQQKSEEKIRMSCKQTNFHGGAKKKSLNTHGGVLGLRVVIQLKIALALIF
jgi:hypothetical protein